MQFNQVIQSICSLGTAVVNKLDYTVYKKHYDGLLRSVSSSATIPQHIKNEYLQKWSQLSKRCTDRDLRLYASFIGASADILPENISHDVIEPILNPMKYRPFYEDKNMFDKILPPDYLPQTYMRRISGIYYDADYQLIENPAGVYDTCCSNLDGFVIKPTVGSSSGSGVMVCKKGVMPGFKDVNEGNKGDFIIQELLKQHASLSVFNPSSINTLRMLVYRSPIDENAYVLNCALRVGKKGSQVDNAHAGGLLIGVTEDGKLRDFAVDQYGNKYQQVNDTVLKDACWEIPDYENLKEFACKIANCIMHHRLLALDIAVCEGENGNVKPVCVEYNLRSLGTWAFQFTNKPVFSDKTDEIIAYCKAHKKEAVKFYGMRN